MPLYDYVCEHGHITPRIVELGRGVVLCPVCGGNAKKVSVYQVSHVMASGKESLGKKYKRFQEASAEIDYTCTKFESETNAKVPDLGLWQSAKREAEARSFSPF